MIQIQYIEPIFFFIYGTILGSFFNVLIYRIPAGISIITPGSSCPKCKKPVTALENIPIISWLLLKGKCSGCKTKISIRYPLVELGTGLFSLLIWYQLLNPFIMPEKMVWIYIVELYRLLVLLILIPISIIDIEHYIIPDSITLGGLILSFIVSFIPGNLTPIESLIGLFTGGGILYGMGLIGEIFLKKESMGGGDVKFLAFIGALWGWKIAVTSIFLGAFAGAFIGLILIAIKKSSRETMIPFGPFLALGIVLSVFWGDQIVEFYLNFPHILIK